MGPSNEWGSSGGKKTRASSSRCAEGSCVRCLADLRIFENTLRNLTYILSRGPDSSKPVRLRLREPRVASVPGEAAGPKTRRTCAASHARAHAQLHSSVFRVRAILCVTTHATHPGNSDTLQAGQICDGNYFPGLTSDQSGKIIFRCAKEIPRERDAGRKWRPTLMLS